ERRRSITAMHRYFDLIRAWPAHVVCFFAIAQKLLKQPEARLVVIAISLILRPHAGVARLW
ncbi:MAG: hypothetical protein R3B51_14535, partial [Thermodesulfobacteriota bacterium]